MSDVDAIRLRAGDNVATVLHPVAAGDTLRVRCDAAMSVLVAADAIPMCHKISLEPFEEGQAVIKYGQRIGDATAPVGIGRHVHIHNLRSARGRAGT